MPQSSLVDRVRTKLLGGALPRERPKTMWGGYGHGGPCDACDESILPAEIEYELDMPAGGRVRMHAGCHSLWMAERIRRGFAEPATGADEVRDSTRS
jgi:hypothetical protein